MEKGSKSFTKSKDISNSKVEYDGNSRYGFKFTMMLCMPIDISVFSFSTNINLRSEEIRIELDSCMTI